jgi:LEA14-like dessication related protein
MNRVSPYIFRSFRPLAMLTVTILILGGCKKPDQEIVLRHIRDVVVDASTEPKLRANAVFYNPNNVRGRLKEIDVEIFVNGKKAASVDQSLKTSIPAASEFTVPLEVKLAMKELGVMDTIFGMIGGKKFDVHYKGFLRLTYRGLPIKVPVDYHDEVRLSF